MYRQNVNKISNKVKIYQEKIFAITRKKILKIFRKLEWQNSEEIPKDIKQVS